MRVIEIVIILLSMSCSQRTIKQVVIGDDKLYGDILDGLPDRDSLVNVLDKGGKTIEVGHFAMTGRHVSNIKVGLWKEYYETGVVRNEGKYKIGSFLDCCTSGLCRTYYSYRTGLWKYYNDKGNLEYELEFEPSKLYVKTRCQGGDSLTYGLIKFIPMKYWDSLTKDIVYELQKIIVDDSNGTITYTPLNGNLYIDYVRRK